jgi:hypothetical protein
MSLLFGAVHHTTRQPPRHLVHTSLVSVQGHVGLWQACGGGTCVSSTLGDFCVLGRGPLWVLGGSSRPCCRVVVCVDGGGRVTKQFKSLGVPSCPSAPHPLGIQNTPLSVPCSAPPRLQWKHVCVSTVASS